MWKWILAGVAALLVVIVAVVATRPSSYHIEQSVHVLAPPRAVYARISDFRRWAEWSPWAHVDPRMKQSFDGAASGTGAEYRWSGNSQIGEGRMSIMDARLDELIAIRMDLTRPLTATSTTELRLLPEADGVRVVWSMDGRRDFVAKAAALLVSMDERLAGDFEKGLGTLKRVAEAEANGGVAR